MSTKTDHLISLVADGNSVKSAAEAAGLSYDAARGILAREARKGAALAQDEDNQAETVRLRRVINTLRKQLDKVEQHNLTTEEVRAAIFELTELSADPPEWILDTGSVSRSQNMPMTIWSDWHLGETVFKEEVNGVNEFNMKIAEARVKKLIERTIDLCFNHMTNPDYPGIIVALNGDMVTGEIHDELTRTNDEDLLPVIPVAVQWITKGLRLLADHFGRVFVPCTAGNHGRTSKRIENKHFIYRNFDWLISTLCDQALADDPRITFHIPASNDPYYSVFGRRFLQLHGHDTGVRGGDGIIGALGPITRGRIKVGTQQRAIGRDVDTLIEGHWHQYIPLKHLIVNNTIKGFDEFAAKMLRAEPSRPSQALWFVNSKYGEIVANWEVFVDDTNVNETTPKALEVWQ